MNVKLPLGRKIFKKSKLNLLQVRLYNGLFNPYQKCLSYALITCKEWNSPNAFLFFLSVGDITDKNLFFLYFYGHS